MKIDILLFAGFIIGFVFYLTPMIWVLSSRRTHGAAKFGWFLMTIPFSWIGLAIFLIFTQAHNEILKALERVPTPDDEPFTAIIPPTAQPNSRPKSSLQAAAPGIDFQDQSPTP